MAIPAYDNDGVVTDGEVQSAVSGVRQGLYDVSTTQKGAVGARMVLPDGRVFRYAYFFSAVGPGKLVAPDATSQVAADGAATAVRNSAGTAADTTVGATTIYLLDTDRFTAANSDGCFAGGYLHTANAGGEGHTYRIRDNRYTASTSVMKLDLYDGLVVALDSESEVAVTGNMYNYLAIANNGTDDAVVGVTVVDMAAGEYGWVQTWGPATVLCDGTIAAGTILTLSDGTNGAVQEMGGAQTLVSESDIDLSEVATEPFVGYAISAGTSTNYMPAFLQLCP